MAYVTIADADIDPESPITGTLMTRLRDNPIAQGEGSSSVPAVQRNIKHLIATATASASATIDFSAVLDSTYQFYVVELINVIPAADGVAFNSRIQTGGVTWQTGAVYTTVAGTGYSAMDIINTASVENTASLGGVCGSVFIFDPSSTSVHTVVFSDVLYFSSVDQLPKRLPWGNSYAATTAVTGIRFYMSSGNIASGEFRLYGISA